MHDLMITGSIPSMSPATIDKVRKLENIILQAPQVDIETTHSLHGGVYTRTITIPCGVILTGALIKIPTTLVIEGSVTVFIGDKAKNFSGYNVMPASANRKQAFVAHTDTHITMIFTTQAKTVEEAEEQFTDEHAILSSRRPGSTNNFIVTGE